MRRFLTRIRWILAILLCAAVPILWLSFFGKEDLSLFPDVRGPAHVSHVSSFHPTLWSRYGLGSDTRLAVLLTDPNSSWLGIAHGLKSIGVPFIITQDYTRALHHRVVLVYPTISGRVLQPEALNALAAFPGNGGILIGVNVLGGGLNDVFGFQEAVPSRERFELRFDQNESILSSFTDPRERVLRLGHRDKDAHAFGSFGYTQSARPLAVYDDGAAAVTHKSYGKGQAYAIGLDLGHLLLKGHNNRGEEITWSYNNRFDPALDVWLRLLKAMYTLGEPDAAILGTVPFGKSLSVILTHDVDYAQSLTNAVPYAEYEKSQDLAATYFVQTKYLRDYNDDNFFDHGGIKILKKLVDLGMEIDSHTVAHSMVFNTFEMGSGAEQYPAYRPFVKDRTTTDNGTILGELRVSKFLLEHFSGQPVDSFRSGYLSYPFALPQALQATGYRYSSTTTANNSLTHLPYQLNYDRLDSMEVSLFEFPVTIEDEELPKLGDRVPQALELARTISRYGGCVVVLIHTDILDHKLEFEKRFIAGVKPFAWFGSLSQFGQWWAARNAIEVDVRTERGRKLVVLEIPHKIEGLTLEIPLRWKYSRSKPSNLRVEHSDGQVVLREAEGTITLVFD